MKIAIASFTRNGCVWNQKLCAALKKHSCEGYALEKYGKEAGIPAIAPSLPAWTERMFQKMDAILFVGACGIAVRSIAPYVKSKKTDPAVLCMDEQGKFVISLLSGHIGGANELTEEVAAVTGAVPVITTATDVNHKFAVDVFAVKNHCEICEMELAKETAALLVDGKTVGFCSRFPVEGTKPEELIPEEAAKPSMGICITTSEEDSPYERTLHLIPKVITVGIGCKKNTPAGRIEEKVLAALAAAGISPKAVRQAASIDLKAQEPGILQLVEKYGWQYRTFSAEELETAEGEFTPSPFVKKITGIDNVCERSAVLAGGRLIKKKKGSGRCNSCTGCGGLEGSILSTIFVVGIGPGAYEKMTIEAADALRNCDVIIGYTVYVDLVKEHFEGKEFLTTPMRKEVERCRLAFETAAEGKQVAMICSGDAGVYGMAGLMYELSEEWPDIEIKVIPGVTAATGGAAVLGAPLIHDFALISLSDLLTPWEKIEKRLLLASEADFVICLYNPGSHKRADYLEKACDLMLRYKAPETVCGIVSQIGRDGETSRTMTLAELRNTKVDMFTTVFIGNSQTKEIRDHMVTPRGYRYE